MAGPYTTNVRLSNGQMLQFYQVANVTAGTYLPCETNGAVSSTSPTDFEVTSPCYIADIVTSQTAGIIEIYSGKPSGIQFLIDATFAVTNNNRQASLPPKDTYVLVPGKRYRLCQKTAGAA